MLEIYEQYLNNIGKSIEKFFNQQKPYIFCKEGCSKCCEIGEYPFSQLEMDYAMFGYSQLIEEEKLAITAKIEKLKKAKSTFNNGKFMHECPFLINKKCSIYKYRGLICRTHGLAYFETGKDNQTLYRLPHCVEEGLNYSTVYDEKVGTISSEKWKKTGIEVEPVSYNLGLNFLMTNDTAKALNLNFGESKALIDWF